MINCFYHTQIAAIAACKRCLIPICTACESERYCPECAQFALFVRRNLEIDQRKRQVQLRDLESNGGQLDLADGASAGMSIGAPALDAGEATARRPRASRQQQASKARPQSLVKAAGWFSTAVAILAAFELGIQLNRPAASAATKATVPTASQDMLIVGQPPASAPPQSDQSRINPSRYQASPRSPQAWPRPASPRQVAAPGGGYLIVTRQSAWMPVPGPGDPSPSDKKAATAGPGVLAQTDPNSPAGAQAKKPSEGSTNPGGAPVAISWPIAGNTLRLTSYVKVHVAFPQQLAAVKVAVDGQPLGQADSVSARNAVPIDTTRLSNGDHVLSALAVTKSGEQLTSTEVPFSVVN